MAPNCTLKANLKRPISQATKSEVGPLPDTNRKRPLKAGPNLESKRRSYLINFQTFRSHP